MTRKLIFHFGYDPSPGSEEHTTYIIEKELKARGIPLEEGGNYWIEVVKD